jgi:hypothetical protein
MREAVLGHKQRSIVMAGLVLAIHVFAAFKEGVDARDKPGHDEVYIHGASAGTITARGDAVARAGNAPRRAGDACGRSFEVVGRTEGL